MTMACYMIESAMLKATINFWAEIFTMKRVIVMQRKTLFASETSFGSMFSGFTVDRELRFILVGREKDSYSAIQCENRHGNRIVGNRTVHFIWRLPDVPDRFSAGRAGASRRPRGTLLLVPIMIVNKNFCLLPARFPREALKVPGNVHEYGHWCGLRWIRLEGLAQAPFLCSSWSSREWSLLPFWAERTANTISNNSLD